MDENVYPFRGRVGSKRDETPEERAERARRASEQATRIQDDKHAAILKKIRDNPIIKPSERLRVANNFFQILADLENGTSPVSKRDVLYAVGQGSGTDSTKRLAYFAVNPELSRDEQDKRASKLTQHIDRYVKLVRAAASLSDRSEKVLIERLVEGVHTYSWSPGDPESVEDLSLEGWGAIEKRVREVSKEIADKHDLQRRFFGRVRELGIGVDSEGNFVQPAGRSEGYAEFQKQALPALIRTDDLPLRPSVYLGEIRSGFDLPCTIQLEPFAGEGDAEVELWDRLGDLGLEPFNFKALASLFLKCWLELVPLRKENIIAPVLRVTSCTLITAAETLDKFIPFGGSHFTKGATVLTADGSLEDQINDSRGDLMTVARDEERDSYVYFSLLPQLDRDPGDAYRKSLHARTPLDHSLVGRFDDWAKDCLAKPAVADYRNYCAATATKMVDLGFGMVDFLKDAKTLTFFPGGTMAALLERSLFDAPEPARLDRLLDESAGALVGKLDAAIDDLRARRRVEGGAR